MKSEIIGTKPWDTKSKGCYPSRIVLLKINKGDWIEYSTHIEVDPSKESRENYFTEGHYFANLEGAKIDFNEREIHKLNLIPEDRANKIMGNAPIKTRIVIHVEGGLVDSVISDSPVEVLIMDSDTEGADGDEIAIIEGDEFLASSWDTFIDKDDVKSKFESFNKYLDE